MAQQTTSSATLATCKDAPNALPRDAVCSGNDAARSPASPASAPNSTRTATNAAGASGPHCPSATDGLRRSSAGEPNGSAARGASRGSGHGNGHGPAHSHSRGRCFTTAPGRTGASSLPPEHSRSPPQICSCPGPSPSPSRSRSRAGPGRADLAVGVRRIVGGVLQNGSISASVMPDASLQGASTACCWMQQSSCSGIECRTMTAGMSMSGAHEDQTSRRAVTMWEIVDTAAMEAGIGTLMQRRQKQQQQQQHNNNTHQQLPQQQQQQQQQQRQDRQQSTAVRPCDRFAQAPADGDSENISGHGAACGTATDVPTPTAVASSHSAGAAAVAATAVAADAAVCEVPTGYPELVEPCNVLDLVPDRDAAAAATDGGRAEPHAQDDLPAFYTDVLETTVFSTTRDRQLERAAPAGGGCGADAGAWRQLGDAASLQEAAEAGEIIVLDIHALAQPGGGCCGLSDAVRAVEWGRRGIGRGSWVRLTSDPWDDVRKERDADAVAAAAATAGTAAVEGEGHVEGDGDEAGTSDTLEGILTRLLATEAPQLAVIAAAAAAAVGSSAAATCGAADASAACGSADGAGRTATAAAAAAAGAAGVGTEVLRLAWRGRAADGSNDDDGHASSCCEAIGTGPTSTAPTAPSSDPRDMLAPSHQRQ